MSGKPLAALPDRVERDIKLIGLGGVGGIVARYLTTYLASLDSETRLVLIDGDSFEAKNAARMNFTRHGNKASVTRDDLERAKSSSRLALDCVPEYVTPANIPRLIQEGDTVLLAVDNHATRKLISDFCSNRLADVCLISGGNDGVDAAQGQRGTYGNVQVHYRAAEVDFTPPLTAYHFEIADPADKPPYELSCGELLVSTPQVLFANLAVASSMLNTLLLHLSGQLHYPEVCFDIAEAKMQPLPLPHSLELPD